MGGISHWFYGSTFLACLLEITKPRFGLVLSAFPWLKIKAAVMNTSSAISIHIVLISEPFPNFNALFHIYLVKQFLGVNQLIDLVIMASPMSQQYLQIQIQDDLKYDVRIENADLDWYFPLFLFFFFLFSFEGSVF